MRATLVDGILRANHVLHGAFDPTETLHDTYLIGIVANGVTAVAMLGVGALLAVNLTKGHQWRTNILGAGTFAIITTCGVGHLLRFVQLMYPTMGLDLPAGVAARYEYNDWHPWVFDLITMGATVTYWAMRGRFPDLVSGAAVYEDLRHRQRQALQIHDNIVQGIVRAKMALDLDDQDETQEAVQATLEASKVIIDDLLGKERIARGQLRRETHAGGTPAKDARSGQAPKTKPTGGHP